MRCVCNGGAEGGKPGAGLGGGKFSSLFLLVPVFRMGCIGGAEAGVGPVFEEDDARGV